MCPDPPTLGNGNRVGRDVAVPTCGALAVHSVVAVVFGPDQGVEHQRADDDHGDDAGHPKKTSTMSLAPDVVSR